MPCNPSIGGTSKGHLVREIDALGGEMGIAADANLIQSRMLNLGKGPAVHSLRAQIDRKDYARYMKHVLETQEHLDLIQAEITDLYKKEDTWYTQVTGDLQGNSMFLFSSDGFYHRLTENDADQIYRDCTSQPEKTPEILKNAVFRMEERGDKDNISAGVIVVENQNSTASI